MQGGVSGYPFHFAEPCRKTGNLTMLVGAGPRTYSFNKPELVEVPPGTKCDVEVGTSSSWVFSNAWLIHATLILGGGRATNGACSVHFRQKSRQWEAHCCIRWRRIACNLVSTSSQNFPQSLVFCVVSSSWAATTNRKIKKNCSEPTIGYNFIEKRLSSISETFNAYRRQWSISKRKYFSKAYL